MSRIQPLNAQENRLWDNKVLSFALWEGDKNAYTEWRVTWQGELQTARLFIQAAQPYNMSSEVFVNGSSVAFSGGPLESWTTEVDILSNLKQGLNTFRWYVRKAPFIGYGDVRFTVTAYIEGTGPIHLEPRMPDLIQLAQYALIGITAIGGIVILATLARRKRNGNARPSGQW